jgi:putative hydrolase of HD superfamily
MDAIEQTLQFIIEVEQLKAVQRKTRPVGLDRYENSAEHSWHVCLAALMLKDFADEAIDIDRVIKMLLIHDLGEIDAGDTIIYASETAEQKAEERAGVQRLLDMLPNADQTQLYLALWDEFEAGESADARYARAIDRVPPLLHNLHDGGHSWVTHNISKDTVMSLNARIGLGSRDLWANIQEKLDQVAQDGLLK